MSGTLYIVATPIGNLEDITLRAIRILKEVDLIAAEDTRHTLKLLNHLEISKPLISYHRHNEESKQEVLIDKLLEGQNIALVSDAGTPGIAVAMINALICSGLDTKEFCFLGFLPLNKNNRKEKLEEIKNQEKTTILYEAPHKLKETLKDLKQIIGERKIILARELTKIHEEFIRKNIDELINIADELKGEFVIIIEGGEHKEAENDLLQLSLEEHYKYYEKLGFNKKEIIKKIAKDRNVNKNDVYMEFVNK